jgi:hypothetical protein
VGDDLGIDDYEIRLKNQWEFESVDVYLSESVRKREAEIMTGLEDWNLPKGGAYWGQGIQWRVTPADFISYSVDVTIIGPKDIPYK